jgi:hypothetical protein
MTAIKNVYRQSEKRLAPKRPCPQCGVSFYPSWSRTAYSMQNEFDPKCTATWYCLTGSCAVEHF